jgi:diguanylate cyclase (GGDEF)-like protein
MGMGAALFRRRKAGGAAAARQEEPAPMTAACKLSHDALLVVEEGQVLFANPAAERLGEFHAPTPLKNTETHLNFYDPEEKRWLTLDALIQRHRLQKGQSTSQLSTLELDPEKRTRVTVSLRSVVVRRPGEAPRTRQLVSIHDAHCEKQLFDLRHLNTLTGLPNQFKAFSDITALTAQGDERQRFAVIMIELDDASRLRSMLGYAEMDEILGHIARVLRELSDGERIRVYHLHYVTFMVLLQRPHSDEAVQGFVERFQQQVQEHYNLQENRQKLTFSAGVSFYPRHRSLYHLINSAFAALAEAQEQGRGHTVLASHAIDRRVDRDINLNTELEKAIAQRDLKLYFQPLYDGRTERLAGAEVLLRWHHPEKGLIMPDLFIPVAEKSGLILQIGQYVIEESLKQLSRWHSFGFPPLQLSVNLSLRELENQDFMSSLIKLLYHYEFGESRLKFEITEHAAMLNPTAALQRLQEIRQLGIGISLDDFGTGYSSFAYLAEFPIETLKIDRSFVTDMTRDTGKQHIVSTITKLGHSLGMTIVAEGVESKEEVALLRSYGVDYLQGYYYDRPLPQLEFQYLLTHPKG